MTGLAMASADRAEQRTDVIAVNFVRHTGQTQSPEQLFRLKRRHNFSAARLTKE
jgi:hypothetical protein